MTTLDDTALSFVRAATGARIVRPGEIVQSLWSGYGRIQRLHLDGARAPSAILKFIDPPASATAHPQGWNTAASHRRKVQSYAVESRWYMDYAAHCCVDYRVPRLLGALERENARYLLLEDLDIDLPMRRGTLTPDECVLCLRWLAAFHARFLGDTGDGLWPVGCYWHLDTRLDEYRAMVDSPIKRAAHVLDDALESCRYQTLVHGDAKVANFCFDAAMSATAAVDFQYVGRGCGIRDVVYFLGSCLSDDACCRHEASLLDTYFAALLDSLSEHGHEALAPLVEIEWRSLYAIAWTDFHRFLLGWMPTHAKITPYAVELAERALADGRIRQTSIS